MTPTRSEIEALVVSIQQEFLQAPAVRLTLTQIARRVNGSLSLCKAVLSVLVDARVLTQTAHGEYQRFFPNAALAPRVSRSAA